MPPLSCRPSPFVRLVELGVFPVVPAVDRGVALWSLAETTADIESNEDEVDTFRVGDLPKLPLSEPSSDRVLSRFLRYFFKSEGMFFWPVFFMASRLRVNVN